MPSPLDEPELPTPSQTPQSDSTEANVSTSDATNAQPLAIGDKPSQEVEQVQMLNLGEGNVIKLDILGPMIINSDGTLSRIQNWQELHPIEQERTVRLLVKKRNLVRLQQLEGQNKGDEEDRLTALKEGTDQK